VGKLGAVPLLLGVSEATNSLKPARIRWGSERKARTCTNTSASGSLAGWWRLCEQPPFLE
jgi:hypothetical protein